MTDKLEIEPAVLKALFAPNASFTQRKNACEKARAAYEAWEFAAPVVDRQPVVIVDESDDGLFIEFIYGEDGNPLQRGDMLYAEQPAPVAAELADRSPEDYAIEHAEYMAKSADNVLAKFQAYGVALIAVDEGGDDGEGELFEAIDTARGDLQESLVDLRGLVYEFRKRSSRCKSL